MILVQALAILLPLQAAVQEGANLQYHLRVRPESRLVDCQAKLSDLPSVDTLLEFTMAKGFAKVVLSDPQLKSGLHAFGPSGEPLQLEQIDAFKWRLASGGTTQVKLVWSVLVEHREQLEARDRDEYEHSYLAADHGMLSMPEVFVRVRDIPFSKTSIQVELPEEWDLHSPWVELDPGLYRPQRESSLDSDFFGVGHWGGEELRLEGAAVELLFAPGQEQLQSKILPLVLPVLRAELELFNHKPFNRYLVFFGRPDTRGIGGSPKDLSMTLFVHPSQIGGGNLDQVAHVLAHEFFHTWSVSRYGARAELRFLNEGFTDYFSILIPTQLEVVAANFFDDSLCEALACWESNPLHGRQSLLEAGGPSFFQDRNAYELIYKGGMAYAALLDVTLKRAEQPLDLAEFMRQFNNDKRWSPGGAAPRLRDFSDLLRRHLGEDQSAALIELISLRELPDLVALFADQGVQLERSSQQPSLRLRANFNGNQFKDLDRSGLAWQLGLRPGDRILSIDGQVVESSAEIRRAWASQQKSVRLTYLRGEREMSLFEPIPARVHYRLKNSPWTA